MHRLDLRASWCKFVGNSLLNSPSLPHFSCSSGKVTSVFDEPYVKEIAAAHKKLPAHVLLRHALQRGLIVLAKSVTLERVKSNFDVSLSCLLLNTHFLSFYNYHNMLLVSFRFLTSS